MGMLQRLCSRRSPVIARRHADHEVPRKVKDPQEIRDLLAQSPDRSQGTDKRSRLSADIVITASTERIQHQQGPLNSPS